MKKVLRIIGLIAVIGVIIAAIVVSLNQKVPNADYVWDKATTLGNLEGDNYFVVYSDIACPYCVAYENAILEHEEEFKKYLEDHDILFEVRVSEFLYRYGEVQPIASHYGAEAIYCAKNVGHFWDYYNTAITYTWNNYFKLYGKSAFPELNKLTKADWIKLGTDIGLGEDFANCVQNGDTDEEILANTKKTLEVYHVNGLPYYKFNKYIPSNGGGFAMNGTWEDVVAGFEIGLTKR